MDENEKKIHGKVDGDHVKSSVESLNETVNEIDMKILELMNKRLLTGKEIGDLSQLHGEQITERVSVNETLNQLSALNKGPLNENLLRHIFNNLIAATRENQKTHSVAYLGPEATFTHIAAMNYFGHSAEFIPEADIHAIFSAVERKTCHFGVVPVENSIEGSVNHTLDLLFESDITICAEQYQTISHDLLSISGDLAEIEAVYSHPQPIGQCRRWLRDNLENVEISECSSTALAAQKASREPKAAAIASSMASQVYSLKIVASNIEDYSKNTTRFLVIGHDKNARTEKDKTSIMFVTAHVPGALYRVLEPIAKSEINMLKLESRPTKHENWNYFFFIDLEGHIEDDRVQEVVNKMKRRCLYLKILGSYPMEHGAG